MEQALLNNVNWLTESIVTRKPSVLCVTETDAMTVSLLSPDSAYAAKTSRELPCRSIAQGDCVQINSSELRNPLIIMETVRGNDVNAVKVTKGFGTGPLGAWIKAYRVKKPELGGVDRLRTGVPVKVAARSVDVAGSRAEVAVAVSSACKTAGPASDSLLNAFACTANIPIRLGSAIPSAKSMRCRERRLPGCIVPTS